LIQSGQWYEFPRGLRLNHVWSDRTTRIVRLYRGLSVRSKAGSGPQVIYPLHGTFDLSQHVCVPEDPTSRDEPGKPLIHDLPDDLPAEHTILIRMVDSEDNIELKIETAEACFGYWKMEPANRKELAVLRNTP
jgi:hypothetical protein